MEKEERQKASRYQADLGEKEAQDKQRENQEEVKQGKQYRDGLNRHGITKLVDYTATCMHNPRIIVKSYLD